MNGFIKKSAFCASIKLPALAVALLIFWANGVQAADPMNIDELIFKGIQTHPLVGSAVADEKAAKEGVTAAKLNFLPTPSISTDHDDANGLVSTVSIRQPLWSGGQLTANVNRAVFENKAASAYVFEQQNTVAKNIIEVWQSYIYAVALQELYANNLQALREFEAMMQRRVSQGVSARIELDLVKNRILQDYNSHQSAVEQQKIAEARLEQMIGEQIGRASVSVPMALLAKYAEEESKEYGALAFSDVSQGNPSVIRQQYQVEAAQQEVKAQQATRYPKLYVQYDHSYYHRGGDTKGDLKWGMSYDPGAGFSNFALERASQARVQSLMQTREAARRTVMENIQTQYQQFVSNKDQQGALVAAIEGAKIIVESYQRQFIAGRKSWLEVLNAVREHSQYQQQLLQVQAQMVGSFYKLRVDFGAMPWQQQTTQALASTETFHPSTEFYKQLGRLNKQKTSTPDTSAAYTPILDEEQSGFVPDDTP